jgi:hypothetical protein
MAKLIEGFDYQAQKPLSLPRKECRERLASVIKGGGFRRVDAGETFAHAKGGKLAIEFYAILPAVQS